MKFTYQGLTLSKPDFAVQQIEGLDGIEARTGGDTEQPRGDGSLPGQHFLGARHVTMQLRCLTNGAVRRLLDAFQPSRTREHPFAWEANEGERRIFARVVASPVTRAGRFHPIADASIALKASDPRIYGDRRLVGLQPFAVAESGLDYPVDYPKDYGVEVVEAIATNAGDSDAHPTIRIHGPEAGSLTSWRLRNTTNGSTVQVDATIGPDQLLTVRLREWVVADPAALIVELDGESRYGDWVTRPEILWLSPGDNVLRLEVLTGDEPSSAEIVYRDTYGGTRRENVE